MPESPNPEETPTEATPVETSPVEMTPVETPTEAVVPSSTEVPAPEAPRHGWDTGRVLVVGILVLVLGAGAGFLIGRSTADSGPATLAAAVDETAQGDLPAGDLSLDQILGAASEGLGKDSGDLLGGLLGGSGTRGDTSGVVGQILEQLGKQFGKDGTAQPSTPDAASPFLGVALEAAPSGQSGATIAEVTAGSPAADAGIRVGDVVTAVDGKAVTDAKTVATAVRAHQPGDQITLTLTRDGASTDVKVRLGNRDSSSTTPTTPPTTRTT